MKALYTTLVITLFLSACSDKTEPKADAETHKAHAIETEVSLSEAEYKVAGVELGKLEKRTLSMLLKVNGTIDAPPQNLVSISAPMGGFVVSTQLLEGMTVVAGQPLVTLEHQDFVQLQQDYLQKKGELEYLELEYKRQGGLREQDVNAAKVYEKAKADYISMSAQLAGLTQKLAIIGIDASTLTIDKISRTVILYAPVSGYVSEVNINTGRYVSPTDVLIELVNTAHLHLELRVFEKDVPKLKQGQVVRYNLPNKAGYNGLASVYLIGKKIHEDRTVRVHAHLNGDMHVLLPGMYVNARIEVTEKKVTCLPSGAVVLSGGKPYVFIQRGKGKFEMLEVKRGVTENGYTEIALNAQQPDSLLFVTKSAFSLLSKMKNVEEEGHGH